MANEKHLRILRRGVEIWNQWRSANPKLIPDLSGNVSHAAYFREAKIQGIDVSKKDWVNGGTRLSLRKKLRGIDLRGAILFGAILNNADLRDADLRDANLSGTLINGADLTRANLTNVNLSGADIEFTDFTDSILT
ncbi:MAG TPA: pentapeptide repeat-containing protein, partial [Thermosynechococcaceae cyanobacterium]